MLSRDGNRRHRERHIWVAHEQMVVFDADRPVRREADFESGSPAIERADRRSQDDEATRAGAQRKGRRYAGLFELR